MKKKLSLLLSIFMIFFLVGTASAHTITFDGFSYPSSPVPLDVTNSDLLVEVTDGYGGLNWGGFYEAELYGDGCVQSNPDSNAAGSYISSIGNGGTPFDLLSASFATLPGQMITTSITVFGFTHAFQGGNSPFISMQISGFGDLPVYQNIDFANYSDASGNSFTNLCGLAFSSTGITTSSEGDYLPGGLWVMDNLATTAPVPEPATVLLLGLGLLGLVGFKKKFRK